MKVIYKGGSDLRYNSAPSGFSYVFSPGVAQEVKPEDEQFFRNKSAPPGSPWRVEDIAEVTAKKVTGAVVDAADKVVEKLGAKNRRGGRG